LVFISLFVVLWASSLACDSVHHPLKQNIPPCPAGMSGKDKQFLPICNLDGLAKGRKAPFFVIPAEAGHEVPLLSGQWRQLLVPVVAAEDLRSPAHGAKS